MVRTLEDYVALPYQMEIVEDRDKDGFVVSFPNLPGYITYGQATETVISSAWDTKRAWIATALGDGVKIPESDNLEGYSGQFKLRVPRSLHHALA